MNQADLHRLMLRLRSLQASIDENTHSIREENQTTKSPAQPPPDIIVRSVVSLPPTVETYYETEQRERPDKERRERIKRVVEYCGVGLLAIYTAFTIGMYCANKQAADAATKAANAADGSLTLTRNSLRATSAGVIFPNIGFQQGAGVANIVFENRGKGNAWHVSATYHITVVSLHGNKPITTMKSKSVMYDVIIPGDGPNDFTIITPYTRRDLENFTHFGEGVRVEGTFRYNNSFEDVPQKDFCLIAILGNGIPCADLEMRLRVNSDPFDLSVPKVPDYYRQYRQKQNTK